MEKILGDKNISLLETNRQNKTNFVSAGNRLAHIEEKIKSFGGLEAVEEEFLKDLNLNNQRLDNIIASIKTIMKVDPKTKRVGVSPLAKNVGSRVVEKDKSSKRLIERVEKAIC
jgi:hypothetical protein